MADLVGRIGRLVPSSSVLFVCDIQETFRNRIYEMSTVINGAKTMVSDILVFSFAKLKTIQLK
jgi:hypothetical protein